MWLSDKGCDETIEAVWTNTNHVGPRIRVVNKVEKCRQALTSWSRKCFGSVRKDLEQARKKLIQAEKDAMISGVNHRVLELRSKVNELIDKEIKMWFQRSRSLRAVHGDRNSKYFHSKATQRFRRNKIEGIKNTAGQWITNPNDVADCLVNYYKSLFTTSGACQLEEAISTIPNLITPEMNAMFSTNFMLREVQAALKQMASLKAPGPDGMPPFVYHKLLESCRYGCLTICFVLPQFCFSSPTSQSYFHYSCS